jgi:hypothetical protein
MKSAGIFEGLSCGGLVVEYETVEPFILREGVSHRVAYSCAVLSTVGLDNADTQISGVTHHGGTRLEFQ